MAPGKKPLGLGEEPQTEYTLVRFEEPLPKSRKELFLRLESIINRGGIQKLVVELGRPIQVVQLVDKAAAPPPTELPPDDLWSRAYNREMVVSQSTGIDGIKSTRPYAELFFAFQEIHNRKLKPKIMFCHDIGMLREWLGLGPLAPMESVFGVETATTADMPDDAVLLVGVARDEEVSDETIGVLVRFDMPRKTEKK